MTAAREPNGYTLVEMLAAMLVLGLAMTALTQTTRLFSLTSRHAALASGEVRESRAAEALLVRALGSGPFGAPTSGVETPLRGDTREIVYACDDGKECRLALLDSPKASLQLSGPKSGSAPMSERGLEFRYVVNGTPQAVFPEPASEAPLESIAIVDRSGAVQAAWRPKMDQSPYCAFDQFNHRCFPKQDGAG